MLSVKLHMDVFPLIGYDVFIVHRKNSHGIVQEGVASPVLVIACEQVCQQLHFRFLLFRNMVTNWSFTWHLVVTSSPMARMGTPEE